MKIFFKYISRCMLEKKGKLLLLLLAITVSTGLLVASIGAVDIAIDSIAKPQLEAIENRDISIASKKSDVFFNTDSLNTKGIKDIIKEIYINGYYNNDEELISTTIRSRDVSDLSKIDFIEGNTNNFNDSSCIISKRTMDDYNLKVNDVIDTVIGGQSKRLKIVAVASNEGPFYNDMKENFTLFVPYDYISKDMNAQNKYNSIIATSTEDDVNDSIDLFNANNNDFEATLLFDEDKIKEQTSSLTSVLYLMLLIVVAMSALIIYSSMKLTVTERMPVIGTFLSQGATIGTIKKILYMESIGYGIIGAIFGNALGIGVLYLINNSVSPLREYGIIESMSINPSYIIMGAVFSIFLVFISSVIPVRRINKLQVKDVILNNVTIEYHIKTSKFIIGLILLIGSIIFNCYKGDLINEMSVFVILISVVGLILMYPKLVDICSKVLYKVLRGHSKTSVLAINNLRTSKVLLGNITLIIVSVLAVILIISVGSSVQKCVTDAYSTLNYDIEISSISTIRDSEESSADKLMDMLVSKGISRDKINAYNYFHATIDDSDYSIEGINTDTYAHYNGYVGFEDGDNKEAYEKLSKDDNSVIISTTISKKINKQEGDMVKLKIDGIEKDYKVSGVINEQLYNNGRVIFINNSSLARDFNLKNIGSLTFEVNEGDTPDGFLDKIKKEVRESGAFVQTKDEQCRINDEQNATLIKILSIFSYMAVVIAALGVLNNIIIGFIQRKRELAVLSSVGMRGCNRNKMIILESAMSVFWSLICAIPYSILGLSLISKTLITIDMPIDIVLDYTSLPSICLISLGIILIATIPALLKSRKLSIIEELKYE